MYSHRSAPPLLIFGSFLALFAIGICAAVTGGLVQTDDAWFLQVVHRLMNGDSLYRDVYYGITPLSMYASAALASLLGAEIIVLKVVMSLCFSITSLLTYYLARRLGLGRPISFLIVLYLLAYLPVELRYGVPYTPMASMFFLATFFALLLWRDSLLAPTGNERLKPAWPLLGIAAASAGLSFASKQNIGLFSLAALMAAILVIHLETRRGNQALIWSLITALGVFLLSVSLALLPVMLSDSWERFLEYAFLGQSSYLEVGRMPYTGELRQMYTISTSLASPHDLYELYLQIQYLVPLFTIGALFYKLVTDDTRHRPLTIVVVIFALAATAELYPNAARSHILNALPVLIVGAVFAAQNSPLVSSERFALTLRAALGVWAALGISALAILPIRGLASGYSVFSNLPHFRAILLEKSFIEKTHSEADKLVQAAESKPIYLFMQKAGYYYLVAGLENPTPYDLPLAPALGLNGESEIIAAIENQAIQYVCMQSLGNHPRKPQKLEDYVTGHMFKVRKLSLCTLYGR
ncbi:MAG: hypothetical protein JXA78_15070 [Anaerolineales bacterium]|nr:hypothetical protein [Anaerolineales bacterium]